MIRRFNYTGRHKVKREDAQFFLNVTNSGHNVFDAILKLDEYNLPPDAAVFVEAYRQTLWMRFDFGTVASRKVPEDRRLTEFDSVEDVLFRVKVISSTAKKGQILAEADRIPLGKPEEQYDNRLPLLPVIPKELFGLVSRVDFEDRPRLEINVEVGDWKQLVREPAFMSMVLSFAIKEILTRILYIEKHNDTEDPDDWKSQWLRFASLLPGMNKPSDDEEKYDDWINNATEVFGRQYRLLDLFQSFWRREIE